MTGAAVLAMLLGLTAASFVFPVHRSFQMRDGTQERGSRGASLALPASLSPASRRAFVVRWDALTVAGLDEALAQGAGGLVIVLPAAEAVLSGAALAQWAAVEEALVRRAIPVPVFFALDAPEVRRVEAELASPTSLDDIELSVAGPTEAPFVTRPEVASFHGWLQGISGAVDMLPTVAVVAHYDTLAAAVHLASGADANGSGLAAVLELARLFSKLYHQPRNRVAVNFLFVVTGGSRFNFAGTEAWAAQMDRQLLDRIDFALCLESLGSTDLHFHFSRPPKTQKIKAVYDVFADTARDMGISLRQHRRKINIAAEELAFEHEVFAKRHVLAFTVSGREQPSRGPSSLDRLERLNQTAVVANIAFLAEALFKHAFGFAGRPLRIFEGSLAADERAVAEWLRVVASGSRVEFVLDKARGKSVALDLIRDRLADYTEQFSNRTYPLREGLVFRDCPQATLMHASLTRSAFFHVALVLGALVYLAGVFAGLEYLAKGRVDVQALLESLLSFGSKQKRK